MRKAKFEGSRLDSSCSWTLLNSKGKLGDTEFGLRL